jgi:mRNA interferase RelE/StbE
MPAENIYIPNKVRKKSLSYPKNIQKRIGEALLILKENPISGIKLHGELTNYFKYRLGDYRIVYRFDNKTKNIYILKIEHRQGVYR